MGYYNDGDRDELMYALKEFLKEHFVSELMKAISDTDSICVIFPIALQDNLKRLFDISMLKDNWNL